LYQQIDETNKPCIYTIKRRDVENALHFIQNSILSKDTFNVRPRLLKLRMFDEFTNSNAESEHSALKKQSLGVSSAISMTSLFQKTDMDATKKSNLRVQFQSKDIASTLLKQQCWLSKYLVKNCFDKIKDRIELSKKCVSKQVNKSKWIVIYQSNHKTNANHFLHFVPMIKRKRYVTLSEGKQLFFFLYFKPLSYLIIILLYKDNLLSCSCQTYSRYGYPCHHLLHVMNVQDTSEFRKEWVHIRWSKDYLMHHYNPNTDKEKIKIYQMLYENQPEGIYYLNNAHQDYPVYKGFNNASISTSMFDVPDSQFMCRKTQMLWIENNASNSIELNQMLTASDTNLVSKDIILSQEQMVLNDFDFQLEYDSETDINYEVEYTNYTEKVGLLKRAQDLCGKDTEKHKELYDFLTNFVTKNEITNDDNEAALKKRKNGDSITISSNKIVHKGRGTNKRTKNFYEM
jgi:hypothetical protein